MSERLAGDGTRQTSERGDVSRSADRAPVIPIARQIARVRRLAGRAQRLNRARVLAGRMSAAQALREADELDAALATLEWLGSNEHRIKARVDTVRAAEDHPAVAATREALPGAEVTAVTSVEA